MNFYLSLFGILAYRVRMVSLREGDFDCLFKIVFLGGKYVNKGDPTVRPLELFMCSVVKRLLVLDMESF